MPAGPRGASAWPCDCLGGRHAFPRSRRLVAAAQFDAVFAQRRNLRGALFVLMGRPNALGHARLGLIVAKKYCPRAVDRNRIRRLAREQFRLMQNELPAWDWVVRLARRPQGENLMEELRDLFTRAETWAA